MYHRNPSLLLTRRVITKFELSHHRDVENLAAFA